MDKEKRIKMTEKEKKPTMCYSYEVSMVIQIFAEDEDSAKEKLDKEGGFVSNRVVTLKDAVTLYNGESL
jgi:hypothetical protein